MSTIKRLLKEWDNRWNRFVCEDLYSMNFYTGGYGNNHLGWESTSGVFSSPFSSGNSEDLGCYYCIYSDDSYRTVDSGFFESESSYSVFNPRRETSYSNLYNSIKYINGRFTYGLKGIKSMSSILLVELDDSNMNRNNSKIITTVSSSFRASTVTEFRHQKLPIYNVHVYNGYMRTNPLTISSVHLDTRISTEGIEFKRGFTSYRSITLKRTKI